MQVLFLCTGNSCRSQMAEGWARALATRGEFFSAGTEPAEKVNPRAVQAMAEKGIDISSHRPKLLSDTPPVDLVIAVCSSAAEACPLPPAGTRFERMEFDDPAMATGTDDEILDVFRRSRDDIEAGVRNLLSREGLI